MRKFKEKWTKFVTGRFDSDPVTPQPGEHKLERLPSQTRFERTSVSNSEVKSQVSSSTPLPEKDPNHSHTSTTTSDAPDGPDVPDVIITISDASPDKVNRSLHGHQTHRPEKSREETSYERAQKRKSVDEIVTQYTHQWRKRKGKSMAGADDEGSHEREENEAPSTAFLDAARRKQEDDAKRAAERLKILRDTIKNPSEFSSFLNFLDPDQKQELLYICEVDQLLERVPTLSYDALVNQCSKICNIFLRTGSQMVVKSVSPLHRKNLETLINTMLSSSEREKQPRATHKLPSSFGWLDIPDVDEDDDLLVSPAPGSKTLDWSKTDGKSTERDDAAGLPPRRPSNSNKRTVIYSHPRGANIVPAAVSSSSGTSAVSSPSSPLSTAAPAQDGAANFIESASSTTSSSAGAVSTSSVESTSVPVSMSVEPSLPSINTETPGSPVSLVSSNSSDTPNSQRQVSSPASTNHAAGGLFSSPSSGSSTVAMVSTPSSLGSSSVANTSSSLSVDVVTAAKKRGEQRVFNVMNTILSLLELSKTEVEQCLADSALRAFLEWRSGNGDIAVVEPLQFSNIVNDSACFRFFLLYLMEDKRHRLLLFWNDLQRVAQSDRSGLVRLNVDKKDKAKKFENSGAPASAEQTTPRRRSAANVLQPSPLPTVAVTLTEPTKRRTLSGEARWSSARSGSGSPQIAGTSDSATASPPPSLPVPPAFAGPAGPLSPSISGDVDITLLVADDLYELFERLEDVYVRYVDAEQPSTPASALAITPPVATVGSASAPATPAGGSIQTGAPTTSATASPFDFLRPAATQPAPVLSSSSASVSVDSILSSPGSVDGDRDGILDPLDFSSDDDELSKIGDALESEADGGVPVALDVDVMEAVGEEREPRDSPSGSVAGHSQPVRLADIFLPSIADQQQSDATTPNTASTSASHTAGTSILSTSGMITDRQRLRTVSQQLAQRVARRQQKLRGNKQRMVRRIALLMSKMKPMHRKAAKVLRLTCWPEFCKSNQYQALIKEKREQERTRIRRLFSERSNPWHESASSSNTSFSSLSSSSSVSSVVSTVNSTSSNMSVSSITSSSSLPNGTAVAPALRPPGWKPPPPPLPPGFPRRTPSGLLKPTGATLASAAVTSSSSSLASAIVSPVSPRVDSTAVTASSVSESASAPALEAADIGSVASLSSSSALSTSNVSSLSALSSSTAIALEVLSAHSIAPPIATPLSASPLESSPLADAIRAQETGSTTSKSDSILSTLAASNQSLTPLSAPPTPNLPVVTPPVPSTHFASNPVIIKPVPISDAASDVASEPPSPTFIEEDDDHSPDESEEPVTKRERGDISRRGSKTLISFLKSQPATHQMIVVDCRNQKEVVAAKANKLRKCGQPSTHQRVLEYVCVLTSIPYRPTSTIPEPPQRFKVDLLHRFPQRDRRKHGLPSTRHLAEMCFPMNTDVSNICTCSQHHPPRPPPALLSEILHSKLPEFDFPPPSNLTPTSTASEGHPLEYASSPAPNSNVSEDSSPTRHPSHHFHHNYIPNTVASFTDSWGFNVATDHVEHPANTENDRNRIFNFILTTVSGSKLYGACLQMYENDFEQQEYEYELERLKESKERENELRELKLKLEKDKELERQHQREEEKRKELLLQQKEERPTTASAPSQRKNTDGSKPSTPASTSSPQLVPPARSSMGDRRNLSSVNLSVHTSNASFQSPMSAPSSPSPSPQLLSASLHTGTSPGGLSGVTSPSRVPATPHSISISQSVMIPSIPSTFAKTNDKGTKGPDRDIDFYLPDSSQPPPHPKRAPDNNSVSRSVPNTPHRTTPASHLSRPETNSTANSVSTTTNAVADDDRNSDKAKPQSAGVKPPGPAVAVAATPKGKPLSASPSPSPKSVASEDDEEEDDDTEDRDDEEEETDSDAEFERRQRLAKERKDKERKDREEKERKDRERKAKEQREREERDRRERERKDKEERERREREKKEREERERRERERKDKERRDRERKEEKDRKDKDERDRRERERMVRSIGIREKSASVGAGRTGDSPLRRPSLGDLRDGKNSQGDNLILKPKTPKSSKRKASGPYVVVILSAMPLVQVLRDSLLSLPKTLSPVQLIESNEYKRLMAFTQPTRVPLDLFGVAQSKLQAPVNDYSFNVLFRCLHPRRVMTLVEALIVEKKVLLVSQQLSVLTLAAECARSLLYPFNWNYLFIPILPLSMFQYLQCPTPFLMGVHACYQATAKKLIDSDTVMFDLDNDEILCRTNFDNSRLPRPCRNQLLLAMQRLFFADVGHLDFPLHSPPPPYYPYQPYPPRSGLGSLISPDPSPRPSLFVHPSLQQLQHDHAVVSRGNLPSSSSNVSLSKISTTASTSENSDVSDTLSSASASLNNKTQVLFQQFFQFQQFLQLQQHQQPSSGISSSAFSTPSTLSTASVPDAKLFDYYLLFQQQQQQGSLPPVQRRSSHSSNAPTYRKASTPPASRPEYSQARRTSMSEHSFSSHFSRASTEPVVPSHHHQLSALPDASLLLRVEFLKMWATLLKNYRNFCIHLPDSNNPAVIFDTPAFLSKAPPAYHSFLTSFLQTSYMPAFLHERTGPEGLSVVVDDAFDRYEAMKAHRRVRLPVQSNGNSKPGRRQLRNSVFPGHPLEIRAWDARSTLTFDQLKRLPLSSFGHVRDRGELQKRGSHLALKIATNGMQSFPPNSSNPNTPKSHAGERAAPRISPNDIADINSKTV